MYVMADGPNKSHVLWDFRALGTILVITKDMILIITNTCSAAQKFEAKI